MGDRSPFRAGFCTVEFLIGGAWVAADLETELSEDGVTIVRDAGIGTGSGASASSCSFRLKDPTGKWSPRHPSSPYYGLIGKGTPLRVTADLLGGAPSTRFYGEVVTFRPGWGRDGARNAVVDVTAAGTLRRIGRGASPLRSPIYRGRSTIGAGLVAYWPCEEGSDATRFSAAVTSAKPGTWTGSPSLGSSSVVLGSDPLPTVEDSAWTFFVPTYSSSTAQVRCLIALPPAGVVNGTEVFRVGHAGGDLGRTSVVWGTGGTLTVAVYDPTSTSLASGSFASFLPANGKPHQLSLDFKMVGSDTVVTIAMLQAGATSGVFSTVTATGAAFNRVSSAVVNPLGAPMTGSTVGHITVESAITSVFDLASQLTGYAGERAETRLARLCSEAGISFGTYDAELGEPMGPQRSATLEALLRECEASDGGLLYEPRGATDLGYRTRRSLMTASLDAVTIPYRDNMLSPFVPGEGDDGTVNVATVQRDGGSSATFEQASGALGTAAVGRYEDSRTLSLQTDAQAALAAQWRAHVGTWDEARFPALGWDYADPRILDDPALVATLQQVTLSTRITVTEIAERLPWLPPFDVQVIVSSYTETIKPLSYRMDATGVPARPYRVGVWDASSSRYSLDGTTVRTAIDATTPTLPITTPAPGWTAADGSYPIVVGGELMTVTAVSGSVPNQTMTVVRSVNGVVKAHAVGEAVELAEPVFYGY